MSGPEPRWLGRSPVDEAHWRQIREHGGARGLRDQDALEAALDRPRRRWQRDAAASLADLAAAYAVGLIAGRPYADGNRRLALVVMAAFLDRNGMELATSGADARETIMAVADGRMAERELAEWIKARYRPRPPPADADA
jgi:death-on-curing protein